MQSKFTKKFLLWFIVLSVVLVPWFVKSALITKEDGVVEMGIFALLVAALTAVIPAIFHKWICEMLSMRVPKPNYKGSDKQVPTPPKKT